MDYGTRKDSILEAIDIFYGEHYYVDGRKFIERNNLATKICELYSIAVIVNGKDIPSLYSKDFTIAYANGFFDGNERRTFNQNVIGTYREIYSFGYVYGYGKEIIRSLEHQPNPT